MAVSVKICGVRDVETARAALKLGADYIGLVLTPSARRVSVAEAGAVARAVPDQVCVAVGLNFPEDVFDAVLATSVSWVQVHGTPPRDWIQRVHQAGKLAVATWLEPTADVVLLDGRRPGSGETRVWSRPTWPAPIWIAGGLTPENVGAMVRAVQPDGVDVSSGVEVGGVKSLERIARFIQEAKYGDKKTSA